MVTPAGLAAIATYADGLGAAKNLVLPRDAGRADRCAVVGGAATRTPPASSCTCGPCARENQFMATNFRLGTDPNAPGDLAAEARAFLDAGVDGIFSDNPDVVAAVMDKTTSQR